MDSCSYGVVDFNLGFLKRKMDDGDIIDVTGTRSATGVLVSFVPASGKTFYLLKASMIAELDANTGDSKVVSQVRNNTAVKDWLGSFNEMKASGSGVGGAGQQGKTDSVIFDSLVGDGAKSYDINISVYVVPDGGITYGTLHGWIEDT